MRYAIVLLVIAALLVLLGTQLSEHDGVVKVIINGNTWEMPIWGFLVRLAIAIALLMVVIRVLWGLIRLPAMLKRFGKNRNQVIANTLLQKGMLAMGKGQWKKAENLLVKGSRVAYKSKSDPGLFLSTAAQAAQQQGADKRRDQYLLEARQLSAEGMDTLTAALSEARLHLDANKPQQALASIQPHRTLHAQNPQLLKIESEAYEQQGNYREVWHLLGSMRKNFANKQARTEKRLAVANALFVSDSSKLADIDKVWSELSRSERKNESILLSYSSGLVNHNREEKAEKLLAKAINSDFSDAIIHAYTQLEVGSSTARLDKYRRWLSHRGDNAYLNYGAAKSAFQSEQFEAARGYAEASLKIQALPETFALLGKICEAMGEKQHALQAYKGSVSLIYANEPQAIAGEILPAPPEAVGLPTSAEDAKPADADTTVADNSADNSSADRAATA